MFESDSPDRTSRWPVTTGRLQQDFIMIAYDSGSCSSRCGWSAHSSSCSYKWRRPVVSRGQEGDLWNQTQQWNSSRENNNEELAATAAKVFPGHGGREREKLRCPWGKGHFIPSYSALLYSTYHTSVSQLVGCDPEVGRGVVLIESRFCGQFSD